MAAESESRVPFSLFHPSRVESSAEPVPVSARVLNVGGNSNTTGSNSVRYGLSYANANNDLSNSNSNLGSRLYFVSIMTLIPTLPCGRRQESIQSVSVAGDAKTRMTNKGIMRHRLNDCYTRICTMPVLEMAADEACSPRRATLEVARFEADRKVLLARLQTDLIDHTLEPLEFNIYTKKERGKERLIADHALYPWRIVECAVAIVIEDDLNRKLIHQTHASIKGHGTHTVLTEIRRDLHNDPKIRYMLTMDISKFYRSIPSDRVKAMLRGYLKDQELLDLLDYIIDSYNATGNTGITLGGRLSPLMANLYLNELDHHIKEVLHVHYYERYMDNFFILGYSKPWLHGIRDSVEAELEGLGLRLNPSSGIVPVDSEHGVDVLGWVVYSDHILIRKRTKERMRRTFRAVEGKLDRCIEPDEHDLGAIRSYIGCLKWFDSYNLRRRIIDPVLGKMAE